MWRRYIALCTWAMLTPWVYAETRADAENVVKHTLAMLKPTTPFQKWQADQWVFSAVSCAREAHIVLPAVLQQSKPFMAGSYSAPNDLKRTCAALAEGPQPMCHGFNTRQAPFIMPMQGFPSDYAFITSLNKAPKEGDLVTVGGYCDLVANKPETRQFYAGPATIKWSQPPHADTINTASGPKNVTMGTVIFNVPGSNSTFPVIVIIQNP